jgi:hypothetical protein
MSRETTAGLSVVAERVLLALYCLDEDGDGMVQVSNARLFRECGFRQSNANPLWRAWCELEERGLVLRLTVQRRPGVYDPTVYLLRDVEGGVVFEGERKP